MQTQACCLYGLIFVFLIHLLYAMTTRWCQIYLLEDWCKCDCAAVNKWMWNLVSHVRWMSIWSPQSPPGGKPSTDPGVKQCFGTGQKTASCIRKVAKSPSCSCKTKSDVGRHSARSKNNTPKQQNKKPWEGSFWTEALPDAGALF